MQPSSHDAERALLGSVLLKPSIFPDVAFRLGPDDFDLPGHRAIFAVLQDLDRKKIPLDILPIGDELAARKQLGHFEDGTGYLVKLANDVPSAENFAHYVKVVHEKATVRRIIRACSDIAARASDYGDYDQFLTYVSQSFYGATAAQQEDFSHVDELRELALDDIEQRGKPNSLSGGVMSGLWALDDMTAGVRPGEMLVVAGRSSVGKTSFASSYALHAALELDGAAMIFSLEMGKLEMMDKLYANVGSINTRILRRGTLATDEWGRLHAATARLQNSGIYIAANTYSLEGIRTQARRWRTRHPDKKGIIIVDYLQLADDGRDDGNETVRLGRISRGLKLMAKEIQVPVLALSQLNRDSDKEIRPPRMSDLRSSGSIEQDADIVVLLHGEITADDKAKKQPVGPAALAERGEIVGIVAKNRGAETGECKLGWDAKYGRFFNLEGKAEPVQTDLPGTTRG